MDQSIPSSNPLGIALKIWVFGITLGPVFFILTDAFFGQSDVDYAHYGIGNLLSLWLIFMAGGAVFSLPSLLLMWQGLRLAVKKTPEKRPSLSFTLALSSVLTFLPFGVVAWENFVLDCIVGYLYPIVGSLAAVWLGVFWALGRIAPRSVEATEPLDAGL